ncbi:hypothetical protein EJB05_18577, partial [Eragrostis curvula]
MHWPWGHISAAVLCRCSAASIGKWKPASSNLETVMICKGTMQHVSLSASYQISVSERIFGPEKHSVNMKEAQAGGKERTN